MPKTFRRYHALGSAFRRQIELGDGESLPVKTNVYVLEQTPDIKLALSIRLEELKKDVQSILRKFGVKEADLSTGSSELESLLGRHGLDWKRATDAVSAKPNLGPVPPGKAPELYRDGERDPHTGRRREFVEQFIARVYATWIIDGELMFGREGLKRLDPECETAVAQWLNRNPGQTLFGMASKTKAVPAPSQEQIREARRVLKWVERHKKDRQPDADHEFVRDTTVER